ncbi:hypothetical protein ACO0SA_003712 [Hanseniaspora valbyensis]
MSITEREIIIVGAGVIGLSSLYRLLEDINNSSDKNNIKYYINIIAKNGPSLDINDIKYAPDYTSFFAGAHQRPFPSDYSDNDKLTFQRRESIYTSETFNFFINRGWNLINESTIKFVRGYDCIESPPPEYANFNDGYNNGNLKNFTINDKIDPDLIPLKEQDKCKMINSYDTYVVNTPLYLSFLFKKCIELSKKSKQKIQFNYNFDINISCLKDAIIFGAQSPNKPVIINCTGRGLQWETSAPDKDYCPIRGQTLLISVPKPETSSKGSYLSSFFKSKENENISNNNIVSKFESATITHQSSPEIGEWTFYIQRPLPKSHPDYNSKLYFIIGGTKNLNSNFEEISEKDTQKLLQNGQRMFPNLFANNDWKLERINVGFRPARKNNKGSEVSLCHKVYNGEPFAIINAYGFAGYGVECSMGAAAHVISLLKRGFRESLL